MYYENFSFVGMVNGRKLRFATEEEYEEYLAETEESDSAA